jgi:hypothetical protein
MLEISSMIMDAYVYTVLIQASDAFEHSRCGTYLFSCILNMCPKLLHGTNNIGVNLVFRGTPQYEGIWLKSGDRDVHDTGASTPRPIQRPG